MIRHKWMTKEWWETTGTNLTSDQFGENNEGLEEAIMGFSHECRQITSGVNDTGTGLTYTEFGYCASNYASTGKYINTGKHTSAIIIEVFPDFMEEHTDCGGGVHHKWLEWLCNKSPWRSAFPFGYKEGNKNILMLPEESIEKTIAIMKAVTSSWEFLNRCSTWERLGGGVVGLLAWGFSLDYGDTKLYEDAMGFHCWLNIGHLSYIPREDDDLYTTTKWLSKRGYEFISASMNEDFGGASDESIRTTLHENGLLEGSDGDHWMLQVFKEYYPEPEAPETGYCATDYEFLSSILIRKEEMQNVA